MKASRILSAVACLALGWAVTPLLPRSWGVGHLHGLFAGAGLYYVAYVRAAYPRPERAGRPSAGTARRGGLWRTVLARAAVFTAVLAAFLYVVFELYRGFDLRWHLATFAAWVLSEDLAERVRVSGAPMS
jgi:hypothetical protein